MKILSIFVVISFYISVLFPIGTLFLSINSDIINMVCLYMITMGVFLEYMHNVYMKKMCNDLYLDLSISPPLFVDFLMALFLYICFKFGHNSLNNIYMIHIAGAIWYVFRFNMYYGLYKHITEILNEMDLGDLNE